MKNFVVLILVGFFFLGACSTITYDMTKPDGTKISIVSKRPIFAVNSVGWNGDIGNINSSASIQMDQLLSAAIAGYTKYQSGGLVSPPINTNVTEQPVR